MSPVYTEGVYPLPPICERKNQKRLGLQTMWAGKDLKTGYLFTKIRKQMTYSEAGLAKLAVLDIAYHHCA